MWYLALSTVVQVDYDIVVYVRWFTFSLASDYSQQFSRECAHRTPQNAMCHVRSRCGYLTRARCTTTPIEPADRALRMYILMCHAIACAIRARAPERTATTKGSTPQASMYVGDRPLLVSDHPLQAATGRAWPLSPSTRTTFERRWYRPVALRFEQVVAGEPSQGCMILRAGRWRAVARLHDPQSRSLASRRNATWPSLFARCSAAHRRTAGCGSSL